MQEGKAYSYRGARTIDAWTEFATTTYLTSATETKDIPRPPKAESTGEL